MSASRPAAEPIRVLHVAPYFAPAFSYGGPPRSILGLCRALQDVRVHVDVLTTTANGGHEDLPASPGDGNRYDGVPVRYLPRIRPRRFFAAAGLLEALAEATKEYDLWHIHGLWNLPAWVAAWQARKCGLPYVLSPRGMLQPGALALRRVRKRLAYPLVERRNLAHATLLHATSPAEAGTLEKRRLGVEIVTLPNGVDLQGELSMREGIRHRLRLDQRADLVVFLGRIHPIKRLDLLAAAFERVRALHPNAHLVIAGSNEGGYRSVVEPLFRGSGEYVHWIGAIDQTEKWSLLAEADVLVLCSASENFGMSVAEALAAGTPVVVTQTCPWEDVKTYGCGFWVAPEADAVSTRVATILGDRAMAREMGARGRVLIGQKYSWTAIGRAMADRYATIVQRRIGSAARS
ncbi:MAG: glycosyltransferase [Candidatus Binatia bacterium]